ncbi:MAG: AraC family transcriptional regulator [Zoogloeaceae bacterium]|nr:AraC family transcriptional regulator [Zoogloeaceae bacterium]
MRSTEMLDFDPEVMAMAVQHGVLEHVQLERGVFRGRIAHTTAPASRIDWGSYALSVLARGDLSPEMVSITLGLGGRGDWRVHGQTATNDDMIVFPEGGEMLVALPPQAQWLSLQVPRARIEAAGLALGRCLEGSARRMVGVIGDGLRQTLVDLAPVLAPHAQSSAFDDAAVAIAHDELLASLFGELARRGGAIDSGASLSPGERWRVIRRAEAYLESRADPSVRIDDLCVAACTSLSRLERAFRETFGVSPRRYLILRRLAAVRRELLRGEPQTSVTDVATRWGFFHLGRFSQEYREHFAERPSQTLRTQRAGSVPI